MLKLLPQIELCAANAGAPERWCTLAIAMILLGASLIGNVAGPTAVGLLNDFLASGSGRFGIRYSLM